MTGRAFTACSPVLRSSLPFFVLRSLFFVLCSSFDYRVGTMITVEFLRDLYAHMEWADARVWAAAPPATPPDDILRNTLLHIYIVQRAFLYVWTNRPFMDAVRKPEDFNSLVEIRAWGQP